MRKRLAVRRSSVRRFPSTRITTLMHQPLWRAGRRDSRRIQAHPFRVDGVDRPHIVDAKADWSRIDDVAKSGGPSLQRRKAGDQLIDRWKGLQDESV